MTLPRLALHALCPYFAMFPASYVRALVLTHSTEREIVFDPFCGRGTTILESLLLGRQAAGSDINPVAYCVSLAKADRPPLVPLLRRIHALESAYSGCDKTEIEEERTGLPPFFHRAFYPSTLRELLFLRASLDWQKKKTDRFIAALTIGSLHGEMDRSIAYFSNQMPRTICLKPDYSVRYWKEHHLFPKKRKVFPMLAAKARMRLKDVPETMTGEVRMIDSRKIDRAFKRLHGKVALVITSPPYLNVTRYEEDQWLRLWFLGGEPRPTYGKISRDDRYDVADKYWQFLKESWDGLAPLMREGAIIAVRIGAIGIEAKDVSERLSASMGEAFPNAKLRETPSCSEIIRRQTLNFLPKSKGCLFEIDHVYQV